MLAQVLAARQVVAATEWAVVRQSAQRHAVFRDQEGKAITAQMLHEKGESLRQHPPVPPFAGDAFQHPIASRAPAHLEVVPGRPAQRVGDERVVVIERDVIERHLGALIQQRDQPVPDGRIKTAPGENVMKTLDPLAEKITRPVHGKKPRGVETLVESVGPFHEVVLHHLPRHLARGREEEIEHRGVAPVEIARIVVEADHRRNAGTGVEVVNEPVGADMRLEQMRQALHRGLHADRAATGKNAVEIMIERLQVRLVDRDEPTRRCASEIIRQRAQPISQRMPDEREIMFDRLRLQPRIEPQPRRVDEVMQRDDRFEAVRAAVGDPLRIAVKRALVEWRRLRVRPARRSNRARCPAARATIRCSCETR